MSLDVSYLIDGSAVINCSSTRTHDGPDGGAGLGAADVGVGFRGSADPVSDLSDSGCDDDIVREVSLKPRHAGALSYSRGVERSRFNDLWNFVSNLILDVITDFGSDISR